MQLAAAMATNGINLPTNGGTLYRNTAFVIGQYSHQHPLTLAMIWLRVSAVTVAVAVAAT